MKKLGWVLAFGGWLMMFSGIACAVTPRAAEDATSEVGVSDKPIHRPAAAKKPVTGKKARLSGSTKKGVRRPPRVRR